MATVTNLATSGDNVDRTTYTTASVTPAGYYLNLLWVYSISATAPNQCTVTGAGLTWINIGSIDDAGNGTGLRRITLFRSLAAVPTAGALTIDYAGQTQTGCAWSLASINGVDQSGSNGSGAIVQTVTNFDAGTVTSLTVTLAAFANSNNLSVGGFGIPLNTAALPAISNGFTLIGQRNQATPNLAISTEYNPSSFTTVTMNCAANTVPWTGIAVEVKTVNAMPNNYQGFDVGDGMSTTEKIR